MHARLKLEPRVRNSSIGFEELAQQLMAKTQQSVITQTLDLDVRIQTFRKRAWKIVFTHQLNLLCLISNPTSKRDATIQVVYGHAPRMK